MADKPVKKIKRRVKNPETFRERALKASEATGPQKRARARKAAGSTIGLAFKPLTNTVSRFFALKAFRPLRRVLRVIGKIFFPAYFRHSWQELRLVTWPGWRESRRLTFAVLIFAVVFGAAVAGVDYGLDKVFKNLLLK